MRWKQYIKNYLQENPFKAIATLGSFIGAIWFFLYYLYIGYMPHIDSLGKLTYLLFVMATMGSVLFSILLIIWIVPALLYLDFEKQIKKRIQKCQFSIALSIAHVSLILILLPLEKNLINGFLLMIFIGFVLYIIFQTRYMNPKIKYKYIQSMLILAIIGVMPLWLYIIAILSRQSNAATNWDAILSLFVFSFLTIILNTYIALKNKDILFAPISILGIGLFLLAIMLYTGTYAIIPSAIMHTFHLGDFRIKQMYVTTRSCNILRDINHSQLKINKYSDTCRVSGKICVLSNIGTNMLLKIDENRTIELPVEDCSGIIVDSSDTKRCIRKNP